MHSLISNVPANNLPSEPPFDLLPPLPSQLLQSEVPAVWGLVQYTMLKQKSWRAPEKLKCDSGQLLLFDRDGKHVGKKSGKKSNGTKERSTTE